MRTSDNNMKSVGATVASGNTEALIHSKINTSYYFLD
jgi:hypothetical protein